MSVSPGTSSSPGGIKDENSSSVVNITTETGGENVNPSDPAASHSGEMELDASGKNF